MENLRLLLFKLSLTLSELALLSCQVLALVFCLLQLFAQLNLSLVHFFSKVLSGHLDLLEFNLEFFHLLYWLLLLSLSLGSHTFLVRLGLLYFDLEINRAVPDCPVFSASCVVFVLHVNIDVLFLLLVLIGSFSLPLCKLRVLVLDLASSLLQVDSFFLKDAAPLSQILFFLQDKSFALPKLAFLLSWKFLDHWVNVTRALAHFFGKFVHMNFLLQLFSKTIMLIRIKLSNRRDCLFMS